jgi:hypothetical protein
METHIKGRIRGGPYVGMCQRISSNKYEIPGHIYELKITDNPCSTKESEDLIKCIFVYMKVNLQLETTSMECHTTG